MKIALGLLLATVFLSADAGVSYRTSGSRFAVALYRTLFMKTIVRFFFYYYY